TPVEVRVDEAPVPVSRTPGQLVEVGERVRVDEGRLPGRSEDDEGAGGDRGQRHGPRPGPGPGRPPAPLRPEAPGEHVQEWIDREEMPVPDVEGRGEDDAPVDENGDEEKREIEPPGLAAAGGADQGSRDQGQRDEGRLEEERPQEIAPEAHGRVLAT